MATFDVWRILKIWKIGM